MAALVDLLAGYPEGVLVETLQPHTTSLPLKYKFLPTLAEFRAALDDVVASKLVAARVEREVRGQLSERSIEEQIREDRKNRPTYDQLMEGVPDSLKMRPKLPRMTEEEFLEKHPHATKEMLSAVPEAPQRRVEPFGGPYVHPSDKPSYTGPIEDVRPGDVLAWDRFDEYRTFMRAKKGLIDTKLWGLNEEWIDNHSRPFNQISVKPQADPTGDSTLNPFDS